MATPREKTGTTKTYGFPLPFLSTKTLTKKTNKSNSLKVQSLRKRSVRPCGRLVGARYCRRHLFERSIRLHESVGVRASDVNANQLPRENIAGAVEPPDVRVTRSGQGSVRALSEPRGEHLVNINKLRNNPWKPRRLFCLADMGVPSVQGEPLSTFLIWME